ncbi:MAG: alpha-isopropylmalate synthase regulatory domain-containing protein, partial [Acidobacteriota bacterium]
QVTALDLEAIVSDEMRERAQSHDLAGFEVEAGTERKPLAQVRVTMPGGDEQSGEASGDGPVDSIFGAIQAATGVEAELREYHVAAVTGGDDALGEVTVILRAGGHSASGQGVATDILEASARAYVRALSNLVDEAGIRKSETGSPEAAGLTGP